MSVKKASFNFDTELLKQLKHHAVELDTTQTDLVMKYIEDGLRRDKNQTKLK